MPPRPRDLRRATDALGGPDGLRVVRAPARVNLIGEHTDYNDGFVLPMAIDREVVVAWRPRADGRVHVSSLDAGGEVDLDAATGAVATVAAAAWGGMVGELVRELGERGRAPVGIDAAVASAVPIGAGLASSAAFAVGMALPLLAAAGEEEPDRRTLAAACRDAERAATGVPVGIMDPLASLLGREDHALLVDCRDLSVQPVPIPSGLGVLVVHSGISRELSSSAYAQRRVACEESARRLGVAALRDALPGQVGDDPIARHVVSENARVREMAGALRRSDRLTIAALMDAGHASLRDDFAVSTPELDLLVDELVAAGALGARLTGAGFGGCVVAIVQRNHLDDVAGKAAVRYQAATGREPTTFAVNAVDGAGHVTG